MKKFLLPFACVLCIMPALQLSAQKDKTSLDFMVGTWTGTGWKTLPTGREESKIKEVVECRLDCSMYVVDGRGTRLDENKKEQVVHEAFGVITYHKRKMLWTMRAYTTYGMTDADIEMLSDKSIRWKMTLPDASIVRYTADFSTPGTWKESGETSVDNGTTWTKMMEMTLEKQD